MEIKRKNLRIKDLKGDKHMLINDYNFLKHQILMKSLNFY